VIRSITLLLLASMTVGLLWPAAAWPGFGQLATSLILLALGLAVVKAPVFPEGRAARWAIAGLAVWLTLWLVGLFRAPVSVMGREPVTMAFLSAAAMLATLSLRGDYQLLLQGLALLLGIQAMQGIVQVFGPAGLPGTFASQELAILAHYPAGDPLGDGLLRAVRTGRASGTLGAPNIFATFVAVAFLLNSWVAWQERRTWLRVIHALLAASSLAAVALSGSRGGVLGLGGALLLGTVLWAHRRLPAPWNARLALGSVLIAVAVIVLTVFAAFTFDTTGNRWLGISGLTMRLGYWRAAMVLVVENPLLGRGAGAFEALYLSVRPAGIDETRFAHSWLMEWLLAIGALGIGAFALLVAPILRSARPELILPLTGMLLHGLFEYSLSFREAQVLFFVLLGCAASLSMASAREIGGARYWCVGPLLVAAWLALGLEGRTIRAAALREEAAAILAEGGDPLVARNAASEAIAADPADAKNWELRARTDALLSGRTEREDLGEATRLNPYSARLQEALASFHASRQEWEAALALQRRAVELHPVDLEHRLRLVELLHLSGDRPAAIQEFEDARRFRSFREHEKEWRAKLAAELGLPADAPAAPATASPRD
jgi:tetratricopeptide (TPR) repeat protein